MVILSGLLLVDGVAGFGSTVGGVGFNDVEVRVGCAAAPGFGARDALLCGGAVGRSLDAGA